VGLVQAAISNLFRTTNKQAASTQGFMPLAVTVFTWLPSNFHAVSANSVVELAMHALGTIGMTRQPTISWQMLPHLSPTPNVSN